MSEWLAKPLNQLASFQKGRKVETSEHPRDGFAPYLGAFAISGKIEEYGDARFGITATAGDVLMLWDGERSGLVGKALDGVIASTVARLSTKGEVEGDFLYYALDANFDWIQNRRTGTGVPHVPKDLGRILSIPFPKDKNEQRRISEILSTVDETIEQTEALIAKYQQIKSGLMHDLFARGVTPDGHLRPTSTQAPHLYKESPLGWIPKEWEVVELNSDIGIAHGFAFSGEFFSDTAPGEALLTPGNFHRDGGLYFTADNTKYFQGPIPPATVLQNGEMVTVMTDLSPQTLILGQFAIIDTPFPLLHNQRIGRVTLKRKERWDWSYLCYALNDERVRRKIIVEATGTTVRHTSPARILGNHIARPPLEEQQRSIEAIRSIQRRLADEQASLLKSTQQKHGLMQDLLTGRVRMKIDESTSN